jgi:UDPglucose--hexose-1-phosphate uridylyltransferase
MLSESVHRRQNPLTGEWVLVSPHRTQRPWLGQLESSAPLPQIHHDPECYLCPGNARAGGLRNPQYSHTHVFDNDFPAITPTPVAAAPLSLNAPITPDDGLLVAESESGLCRVLCYSPDHAMTMSGMDLTAIGTVIDCWRDQFLDLGNRQDINHVQIFENRGAMMGASNPHPHGQVWASHSIPNELHKESRSQQDYLASRNQCLLCNYAALELQREDRVVFHNAHFVVIVPYWAQWPFETLVLPLAHAGSLASIDAAHHSAFAETLQRLTQCYDAVFASLFPYSMGLHQQPTDGAVHAHWHWHAHFYPPLLRSATVRKFVVGYELLAGPQRDITPESAASRLRDCLQK